MVKSKLTIHNNFTGEKISVGAYKINPYQALVTKTEAKRIIKLASNYPESLDWVVVGANTPRSGDKRLIEKIK